MLYELVYLLPPQHTPEEAALERGKVQELIKKFSGTEIQEEDQGKRKLAYRIGQATHAYYTQVRFQAESTSAKSLQEALRLDTAIMRFELTHGIVLTAKEKMARSNLARASARPIDIPTEVSLQQPTYNQQPAYHSQQVISQQISTPALTPQTETPAPVSTKPQVIMEDLDKKLAELLEDAKI